MSMQCFSLFGFVVLAVSVCASAAVAPATTDAPTSTTGLRGTVTASQLNVASFGGNAAENTFAANASVTNISAPDAGGWLGGIVMLPASAPKFPTAILAGSRSHLVAGLLAAGCLVVAASGLVAVARRHGLKSSLASLAQSRRGLQLADQARLSTDFGEWGAEDEEDITIGGPLAGARACGSHGYVAGI